MDLSTYLAQVFGIYFFVAGIALLLNKKYFRKAVKSFLKNEGSILFAGSMTLLFWSFIALKHNVWEGWPIIITIIAWVGVLKGLLYLLFPEGMARWGLKKMKGKVWTFLSIVVVILGLCLLYHGFLA